MNTIQRIRAMGKTVIGFRADGCMAHDHKFLWIGKIVDFRIQERGDKVLLVDVEVIKRADDPTDIRDKQFPRETVPAAWLSKLTDSVYMVMS